MLNRVVGAETMPSGSLTEISELTDGEIFQIFDRASHFRSMEEDGQRFTSSLDSAVVATLFFEGSTRTRLSFTMAGERLGAKVIDLAVIASSVSKGESLKDTCNTVAYSGADAIVVRHQSEGAPRMVSQWTGLPVINGGDGCHEHPTQALSDAYSLARRFGSVEDLANRRVAIVGDILHSRVARSLCSLLPRLGMEVVLVGPHALMVPRASALSADVSYELDEVLSEVDVVYLLRIQRERIHGEAGVDGSSYRRRFQLDQRRLSEMRPDGLVMHPGPVNHGVELGVTLPDERSLISEQVRNGVLIRMAVFERAFGLDVKGGAVV